MNDKKYISGIGFAKINIVFLILFLSYCFINLNYNKICEFFEENNKCAFVIPLHPKHFDYGYYIYDFLIDKNVDLYFIFTNLEDKHNFNKKFDSNRKFLILSDYMDLNVITDNNSYAALKKLHGISILNSKYDYISCIDSEIKFINDDNNYDYYKMMKNIVESKIICGGKSPSGSHINKIITDTLTIMPDVRYHEKLKQLSNNFSIYTWWSNLPVYDCKKVIHFLEWINFSDITKLSSFNFFDDLAYNYFCVLFYDYDLKVIKDLDISLEFADSKIVEYTNDNICKIYWVASKAYKQNKNYYINNNFIIVYHLDRDNINENFVSYAHHDYENNFFTI